MMKFETVDLREFKPLIGELYKRLEYSGKWLGNEAKKNLDNIVDEYYRIEESINNKIEDTSEWIDNQVEKSVDFLEEANDDLNRWVKRNEKDIINSSIDGARNFAKRFPFYYGAAPYIFDLFYLQQFDSKDETTPWGKSNKAIVDIFGDVGEVEDYISTIGLAGGLAALDKKAKVGAAVATAAGTAAGTTALVTLGSIATFVGGGIVAFKVGTKLEYLEMEKKIYQFKDKVTRLTNAELNATLKNVEAELNEFIAKGEALECVYPGLYNWDIEANRIFIQSINDEIKKRERERKEALKNAGLTVNDWLGQEENTKRAREKEREKEEALKNAGLTVNNWFKKKQDDISKKVLKSSSLVANTTIDSQRRNSNVNNYNNNKSNTFSPTINIQGNIDSTKYRREMNRIMRQEAALVAR